MVIVFETLRGCHRDGNNQALYFRLSCLPRQPSMNRPHRSHAGTQNRIPSGEASSGEELLNRLITDHKAVPSGSTSGHHKKHVIRINKPL
jgi:hypothetical protein